MDTEEVRNVKDSNGNRLADGDSVQLIKDLKIKNSSQVLKRGLVVTNIRLTNSDEEIEGSGKHKNLVLKACFVKKA